MFTEMQEMHSIPGNDSSDPFRCYVNPNSREDPQITYFMRLQLELIKSQLRRSSYVDDTKLRLSLILAQLKITPTHANLTKFCRIISIDVRN